MERVYEVLNKQVFTNGDYRLVPIRSEDRYLIMRWRNDQMYHLRQSELLTIVSQDEYFNNVVNQLFNERNPSQIIFSLLINDSCVGYGGLVHLDWNSKSAEISLLIGTEYEQNYFDTIWGHYLQMIQEVAFNDLGLNKIYTYAFDLRPNLYPLLESNKFTKEAVLTNHVKIDNSYVNVVIHSKFNPLSKETKNFGILVTSVSDKVSLIKDVRQAINDLRLNANLLGCDIRDSNVSKFFLDEFLLVDEFTSSYVEKFLEMCKHKHIKYIIPTREGDLIFFERYKNIFDGSEIQIMLADDIDRFSDKLIFYRRYENELNVIPTYVNFDEIPSGKRYVVKERFGSGSKNLFVDITKDEVEAAVRLLQNPVIQPYIVGDEYSLDGYCDQHGCPVGLVIRKRSYVVNGESKVTIVVESSSELYSTLIDVISRLRIQYHFVLQFIVDRHGKVHIMECNARYGGASSVALFVGLKSFHWYLGGMNFNINKRVFTPDRSVTQVRHESNLHLW